MFTTLVPGILTTTSSLTLVFDIDLDIEENRAKREQHYALIYVCRPTTTDQTMVSDRFFLARTFRTQHFTQVIKSCCAALWGPAMRENLTLQPALKKSLKIQICV